MSDRRRAVLRALRELQNPQPPDVERRRQDSRLRILEATLDLILANGWCGLTMEAIAARARVSKTTIYRWWPSKGAVLFDAVAADGFSWPAFPDTGDFEKDLVSAIRNLVVEFSEPSFGQLMRAIIAGAQEDENLARELDAHLCTAPVDAITDRVESARGSGQVDGSVNADILADLIYGAIFRRWLLAAGELDLKFADAVTDAVLRTMVPARA